MGDIVVIFSCQFLCVYLLGMQSLMVRDNNILGAMTNSLLIGVTQFPLYELLSELGTDSIGSVFWFSFVLAGPLAIATSMKTHPYINQKIFRR